MIINIALGTAAFLSTSFLYTVSRLGFECQPRSIGRKVVDVVLRTPMVGLAMVLAK